MRLIHDLLSLLVFATFARLASALSLRSISANVTSSPTQPCELASSASSSFAVKSPEAKIVLIPAEVAYNCLETIPNHVQPALDLLYALHPLLEFQSTIPYLKSPPSGYLYPGIDLEQGLANITANVAAGAYNSEYDFQLDIQALLVSARDGHLSYNGDVVRIFVFTRTLPLVSVSTDGFQIPQIYAQEDLITAVVDDNGDLTGVMSLNTSFTPSPIKSIDGIDVTTFLLAQSLVNNIQDPDASYNFNFVELAQAAISKSTGVFTNPGLYPGPFTTLEFANGTSRILRNLAAVEQGLSGIINGDDMYSSFCNPSAIATVTSSSMEEPTPTPPTSSIVSIAPAPTSPGYPYPIIKHSENVVAGYFLNGTAHENVAVLSIPSFDPSSADGELEFQQVVQKFLADAKQADKTKLVVDLQANAGGIINLGLDTFAQLFPSMRPNTQGDEAATIGLNILGTTLSNIEAGAQNQTARNNDLVAPLTVQALMKLDGSGFPSWSTYFGPISRHGGNFTSLFQDNYTNPILTDDGSGIVITGTNNRKGFTQPFAASDIILLYDGFCASTCSIFSELMKNLGGVQSIAVGGRPQLGPMQGVGGVKGSNNQDFRTAVPGIAQVISVANQSVLAQAQGTVFANFSSLPLLRAASPDQAGGINFRNNIRIGDLSATPLQFVYEAADCRLWYTKEMLSDPTFLWNRVADVAFNKTNGTIYSSPYCVNGSTGQPTSLSGGLQNGTLGPQIPPLGAKSSIHGWLINGTTIKNSTGSTPAVIKNGSSGAVSRRLVNSWLSRAVPVFIALAVWLAVL